MVKKRKPLYNDFDDEFADDALDDEILDLIEPDVVDTCGKPNAARGTLLFANGAVSQRSFDGNAIHATVRDGTALLPVVFDLNDFSNSCSDTQHARLKIPNCEHIAALMYAFIREPDSFMPQTMGDFINLIQQNPAALDKIAGGNPQIAATLSSLQNAPPDIRAAFEKLPMNPTAQDVAAIAPQMQTLVADQKQAELKSYLYELSVDDLRAIAQRRGWKLDSTAKEKIIATIGAQLKVEPRPAEFFPEEEQLLRLLNTLYGTETDPDRAWLERLWKKRAGGNTRQLDTAVRGLQAAGVLFPCTREGARLHYHWSPFVDSNVLPLFTPKIKLYPVEKIGRVRMAEPLPPILPLIDAAMTFAEREPLRLRPRLRDAKIDRLPFIQDWNYDPKQVAQINPSYFYGNVLTVPLTSNWTDETLDVLETLVGGTRELGAWMASTLFTLGIVKDAGDGNTALGEEQLIAWRALNPQKQQELLWLSWLNGAAGFIELRLASQHLSLIVERALSAENLTQRDVIAEIGRARQFVARLLQPLDPLTWYSWKSFAEFTRDLRPNFLYTLTNENLWWLAAAKTRHHYQAGNTAHWDVAHRPILAAMLEGVPRWLGAVELAYDGNELAAFQITAFGAWLLSGGKSGDMTTPVATQELSGDAIRWLDDSTCRLRASPETARVLPLLRACADPTPAPLTYRISNASLARAFERGIAANELMEQFAQAGAPLPAALRERVGVLAANYGRTHLYEHLTVLELADDFALRELIAGTSLGQHIVHQFSPRVVVVRDEGVDDLVNEMVKKGYTPRVMTHEPMKNDKNEKRDA